MEELKTYIEERITFIQETWGKLTKSEQELQKVLDLVNGYLQAEQ